MQTSQEAYEIESAAQKAIHQAVLPGFIEAARAGYTAKQMLAYLKNAKEGMMICAAFHLSGENLVASLSAELES